MYDPYGQPFATAGTFVGDFGFTGEQTDGSGQVFLRARYYDPGLGVFTALDPFEGMMGRPMSLNGYSWVEGNVPNAVDPSGKATSCECECFEQIPEIAEYQSMGIKRRYDRCMKDCLTRIFTQLTVLNPTSTCSYIDMENRIAYGCLYNRTVAQEYATRLGTDAFRAGTPGFEIKCSGCTDCTNFVSQVLFAGGFLLTDNWYYTSNGTNIQEKTPSWSGVNSNMAWLSGNAYPRKVTTDIVPLARITQFDPIRVDDLEAVSAVGALLSDLLQGDVIAYEIPAYALRYDHQAIFIGWGCPYDYDAQENRCPDGSVSHTYQTAYSPGLVPWIVDHGETLYSDRQRPYNHQQPYVDDNVDVIVHSIAIPADTFNIEHVIIE